MSTEVKESSYPEGGLKAWSVVIGAWCAMIPSMGLLNTIGVLQAWISQNQLSDYSEFQIGWIPSTYAFFLCVGGAQVGLIFDSYDVRVVIIPGSIGIVTSLMCLSVSTEYYHFLLSFGVLGGISASMLFTPSVSAVAHWFCKRRALAVGIACTAGGVGGIAFPLMILYLAPKIGFPWTMRLIGLICVIMCIAACVLLRKRIPNNKKAGSTIDFKALRERNYALTTVSVFLVEFAVFIPYTYLSSYAIHAGLESQHAYRLIALLNAGAIPGRALPGYVADKFGSFNVMLATSFSCSVFIFSVWLTAQNDETRITAFAVAYGFTSGAAISLTPVCVATVCKIEDYGKRNGTTFSISSFAALIGAPIAGAILQANDHNYMGLIIFAGAAYTAASLSFGFTRGIAGGWKWNVF